MTTTRDDDTPLLDADQLAAPTTRPTKPTGGRLVHHRRRIVPAVICASVIATAAVLAGISAVTALATGSRPDALAGVSRWFAATPWSNTSVLLLGIGIALSGLWLLVLGLKPGPVNAVPLAVADRAGVRQAATVLTRSSLARLSSATAEKLDGVDRVASSVGARSIKVSVETSLRDPSALEARVSEAIRNRLTASGIAPLPTISVRATSTEQA